VAVPRPLPHQPLTTKRVLLPYSGLMLSEEEDVTQTFRRWPRMIPAAERLQSSGTDDARRVLAAAPTFLNAYPDLSAEVNKVFAAEPDVAADLFEETFKLLKKYPILKDSIEILFDKAEVIDASVVSVVRRIAAAVAQRADQLGTIAKIIRLGESFAVIRAALELFPGDGKPGEVNLRSAEGALAAARSVP
jgi:hypothetical protein